MRQVPAIAAALLVALAAVGIAVAATTPSTLVGTVGPGFTITLRDAQGNAVTRADPGEYEVEVDDRSDEHNFHLSGPGDVDVSTGVPFVGKQSFKVTLVDGRYTFVCDPHASTMRGAFAVGSGATATPPPPPAPASPKPSAPKGARLALTVGPGFTISLKTFAGRKVTRLRPGAYTLVVRDRSRIHNARVRGATKTRATGVRFLGTRTWRVVLRRGTLVVQCDPHKKTMRQTIRIA
jgi:plastocyanin